MGREAESIHSLTCELPRDSAGHCLFFWGGLEKGRGHSDEVWVSQNTHMWLMFLSSADSVLKLLFQEAIDMGEGETRPGWEP